MADLRSYLPWNAKITMPSPRVKDKTAQLAFDSMLVGDENFWAAVGLPFLAEELTREQVRKVIKLGLIETWGDYKSLTELFNIPGELEGFLDFLKESQCYIDPDRIRRKYQP